MGPSGSNDGNRAFLTVQQILTICQYADCLFGRYILQFHRHGTVYGIINDQIDAGAAGQPREDRADRGLMNADIESPNRYRPSGQHQPYDQESHLPPQPVHLKNRLHE